MVGVKLAGSKSQHQLQLQIAPTWFDMDLYSFFFLYLQKCKEWYCSLIQSMFSKVFGITVPGLF